MTRIEGILARARLAGERTVPRDIVDTVSCAGTPQPPAETPALSAETGRQRDASEAAEDLRALCETLVSHTPAHQVADFVTAQVPEPRSALVLACVLQLTDTDDGARFWWQYAAGAASRPPPTASTSTTSPPERTPRPTGGTSRPMTSSPRRPRRPHPSLRTQGSGRRH